VQSAREPSGLHVALTSEYRVLALHDEAKSKGTSWNKTCN
jgi:hypothetical protein